MPIFNDVLKLDKPYNHPVGTLMAIAMAELESAGLLWGCGMPGWDTSALYIKDGDRIVAILIWHVLDWKQCAFVDLGYVVPEYRGQGLYTRPWNALVDEAKTRKLRSIESGTHPDNHAMRAVRKRQGRKIDAIGYRYDIELAPSFSAD